MDLRQYIVLVWRWVWLIALSMILSSSIAFAVSWNMTPIYSAASTILINQAPANKSLDYNSLLTSERVAKTYAELMRKRPVLEAVIASLKLNMTPGDLVDSTQISVVRDTQLMAVVVRDTNPQRSADIANEIVKVFTQQNRDVQSERYTISKQILEQQLALNQADIDRSQLGIDALKNATTLDQLDQRRQLEAILGQYRDNYATLLKSLGEVRLAEAQTIDSVNIVEAAQAATKPVSPRTSLNTVLGAIVGALLALGFVFLRECVDDTVKTSDDVTKLIDTMTLATVARMSGPNTSHKLAVATDSHSSAAESYRMLRVNLEFATIDRPFRTLVVTSANTGEGKSTTAANLAVALAQAGKRVILVDTDLRRPALHHMFGLSPERGVTTALVQHTSALEEYLLPTGIHNLWLMPSGPLSPSAAEMIGSQRIIELIERLKEWADVVVFDSPPVLSVIDSTILGHICDAMLLVVLAGKTRSGMLRRAHEQLAQSGGRVLGVVLNGISSPHESAYNLYYGYGQDKRDKWRRNMRWPFKGQRGSILVQPTGDAAALETAEIALGTTSAALGETPRSARTESGST